MLGHVIYALVIVTNSGQDRIAAYFPTRDHCLAEAQHVEQQGPTAYCFPTNQMTQADIQDQFDSMMTLLRQFRTTMEKQ